MSAHKIQMHLFLVVIGVIVLGTATMASAAQATADQATLAIVGVASSATPTSVTVTWSTNQPTSSRLDWGTSPDALTHSVMDSSLSTSHSLTANGLTPGTTYWIEITAVNPQGQVVKKTLGGPQNPEPAASPAVVAPLAAVAPSTRGVADAVVCAFEAG